MGLRKGSLAERLSTHFRRGRDHQLRALIERIARDRAGVRIIDMGGSVPYWLRVGTDFLRLHHCHVTILNLHASELGDDQYPSDILALEVGDACDMPQYGANSFDLSHSNSVVEHLHTWPTMKRFAAETRRVAASYYVQTPNFWFPIDPHYYGFPFFHWLPRPLRASLFRRFKVAHGGRAPDWDHAFDLIDQSRLLDRRQMQTLFPDGRLTVERLAGLGKSLIMTREPDDDHDGRGPSASTR